MLEGFDLRVQRSAVRAERGIIISTAVALESRDGILAIGAEKHVL